MSARLTATRRLQFCAGHRVYRHETKCKHLHGHNYVAYFEAEAEALDALGRVIDFGVLKARLGDWLEREWDHGMILWEGDAEAIAAVSALGEQKLFRLPENPTAERMAEYLLTVVGPDVLAGTGVRLVKVELHETENCVATARLADVRA